MTHVFAASLLKFTVYWGASEVFEFPVPTGQTAIDVVLPAWTVGHVNEPQLHTCLQDTTNHTIGIRAVPLNDQMISLIEVYDVNPLYVDASKLTVTTDYNIVIAGGAVALTIESTALAITDDDFGLHWGTG